MRILANILRTFKVSSRESCKITNRRYSSQICPRIRGSCTSVDSPALNVVCVRSFTTTPVDCKSSGTADTINSKSGNSASNQIIPVALLKTEGETDASPLKVLVIPINLFNNDEEAVQKTMSTMSVIRDNADQIDAFTDNASAFSKKNYYAKGPEVLGKPKRRIEEPLWQDLEVEPECVLSNGLNEALAEQEVNRLKPCNSFDAVSWNESKAYIIADVPPNLEKRLGDAGIASMDLAFEMDMTNIKDALLMRDKLANDFDEFGEPVSRNLRDPLISLTTSLESDAMDMNSTVPLNFNALIQGTVNIDSSKLTAKQVEEMKVPQFNDYVTTMAANICSTALQKGFPTDLSRMYSTKTTSDTPKRPRSPHVVCERQGEKGCISPGNAELEPYVPKGKRGISGSEDKEASGLSRCETLLTSTIIGDTGARGLMSCRAYAIALKEAARLRELFAAAKKSKTCAAPKPEKYEAKKVTDCDTKKPVSCPDKCVKIPCGPPKHDSICKDKQLRDPPTNPPGHDRCFPQDPPCKKADSKPAATVQCGTAKVEQQQLAPDEPPCKSTPFKCPTPKKKENVEQKDWDNNPCRQNYPKHCPPRTSAGKCKRPVVDPCAPHGICPKKEEKKPEPPCPPHDPCKDKGGKKVAAPAVSERPRTAVAETSIRPRSPNIVCQRQGEKGCISPGNAELEPYVAKGAAKSTASAANKATLNPCASLTSSKATLNPSLSESSKAATEPCVSEPLKPATACKPKEDFTFKACEAFRRACGKKTAPKNCEPPPQCATEKRAVLPKCEAVKTEQSKCGAVKAEPPKCGAVKAEPPKCGAVKAEPPKCGAVKAEPPKCGAVKAEPLKCGAIKVEPPKYGAVKAEPPKCGAVKAEPPKCGAVKAEPPKCGAVKAEPSKCGAVKAEPPKSGAVKAEPPKCGAMKAESPKCDVEKSDAANKCTGDKANPCSDTRKFGTEALKQSGSEKSVKSYSIEKVEVSMCTLPRKETPSTYAAEQQRTDLANSATSFHKTKLSKRSTVIKPESISDLFPKEARRPKACAEKFADMQENVKSNKSVATVDLCKPPTVKFSQSENCLSERRTIKSDSTKNASNCGSTKKPDCGPPKPKQTCGPPKPKQSCGPPKPKQSCGPPKPAKQPCGGNKPAEKTCGTPKQAAKAICGSDKSKQKKASSDAEQVTQCPNTTAVASKSTKPNCPKGSGSGGKSARCLSTFNSRQIFTAAFDPKTALPTSQLRFKFGNLALGSVDFYSKKSDKDKKNNDVDCPTFPPRPKKRFDIKHEKGLKDCFYQDRLDDPCHRPPPKDPKVTSCNRKPEQKGCWEDDENKHWHRSPTLLLIPGWPFKSMINAIQYRQFSSSSILGQNEKKYKIEDRYFENNAEANTRLKMPKPKNSPKKTKEVQNEIIRIGKAGEILKATEMIEDVTDYDVLVRVGAIAISGSDIHVYETGGDKCIGITIGHDATGIVERVGKCVDNLKPGDCVAMESGLCCGICDVCKQGDYNLCPQLFHNGFFSTHQTHPADLCHKIPDSVSLEDATLTSTLALGCQACLKAQITPTTNVLVIGTCPKACAAALCARALGAKSIAVMAANVYTLESIRILFDFDYIHYYENEANLMEKLTERVCSVLKDRPNVIINFAISEPTMNMAINLLKPGGKCVLAECDQEHASFNAMDVLMKSISLVTSFRSANMFPIALNLMKSGKTPIGELVSRIYTWDQLNWGFHWAQYEANMGNRKVIVQGPDLL